MRKQDNQQTWTILKILNWTTDYFRSKDIDSPRIDAEILLADLLDVKRIDLYIRYDQPLNAEELAYFKSLIKRRAGKEPVAYIIGHKDFFSSEIKVTPDVLIPRPDTEILVEKTVDAIKKLKSDINTPLNVIELGTGSGAVLLSVMASITETDLTAKDDHAEKKNHPGVTFYGSDISLKALKVTKENIEKNGERAFLFCGNWLSCVKKYTPFFHVIMSNPPYIASGDLHRLMPDVRNFEPWLALDGGIDGLSSICAIIKQSKDILLPGGFLLLEIGFDQKDKVFAIAESMGGYNEITCTKDYAGNDRVISMRKKLYS